MASGRIPSTANSPITAKGDLFTFSTAPARLAVGNNGESLVADSSTSTGLRYQPTQAAGKNGVINGGFDNWQRGTSGFTASQCFNADRWNKNTNTAFDVSRQLTGDTTNLPFIQYCARVQRTVSSTSTTTIEIAQSIDNDTGYNYLGRTVTYSFYARKGANYSGSTLSAILYGGTGTNQNVLVTGFTGLAAQVSTAVTLTTSWQRFQATATIGSTITQLAAYFAYSPSGTAGANDYIEVTGVQLEVGSIATAFTRAGGTIQGELAACQRYYYVHTNGTDIDIAGGWYYSATSVRSSIKFPVTMRIAPSLVATSGTNCYKFEANSSTDYFNDLTINSPTPNSTGILTSTNVSGTAGQAGQVFTGSTTASVAFNAEL